MGRLNFCLEPASLRLGSREFSTASRLFWQSHTTVQRFLFPGMAFCALLVHPSSHGAVLEFLVTPEVAIPDGRPATVMTWSVGGFPKFDSHGNGYLTSSFSGRLEIPDDFDDYFGGSALVELTGPDVAEPLFFDDLVIPDDEDFVLSDFWPHSDGEVLVIGRRSGEGSPGLYALGGGGLEVEHPAGISVDGVGARNGRTVFHTTSMGLREHIKALIPGGAVETLATLGDSTGEGITMG